MKTRRRGGCACKGGKRKSCKRGGSMVGDAILAGTAVGLYSYFTRSRKTGGGVPKRRTKRALV
jgi:hypothetical protein